MYRTYCITDLHAHYEQLEAFLKDLDENDVVYFLGDAEDKGPFPMACMLYLAQDKRFKCLLGNHDYMMYRFLIARKNGGKNAFLSRELRDRYEQWIEWNYGGITLDAFDNLDEKDKEIVMNYLENAKLIYPDVEVNGKHFVLVHAYPWQLVYENVKDVPTKPITMKDVKYRDDIINDYVWKRPDFPLWKEMLIQDKTIITGHTSTRTIRHDYYTNNPDRIYASCNDLKRAKYINIDCCLAADDEKSRLCALCLDDMSVRYY